MSETTETRDDGELSLARILPMGSQYNSTDGHPVEAVADQEQIEAQPETGDAIAPEEPPPVATQDGPPPSEDKIPLKALIEERNKRQELERRIADMQAEFERSRNVQPPQPPATVEEMRVDQMLLNERMNFSEIIARREYPDLDEKLAAFQEEAQRNPALIAPLTKELHPWEWVYKTGAQILAVKALGDNPADALAKAREEGRQAGLQEGLAARSDATPRRSVPTTLATIPTADGGGVAGPEDIDIRSVLGMGSKRQSKWQ